MVLQSIKSRCCVFGASVTSVGGRSISRNTFCTWCGSGSIVMIVVCSLQSAYWKDRAAHEQFRGIWWSIRGLAMVVCNQMNSLRCNLDHKRFRKILVFIILEKSNLGGGGGTATYRFLCQIPHVIHDFDFADFFLELVAYRRVHVVDEHGVLIGDFVPQVLGHRIP
nr:hypothetical protein CFP56_11870 [Quercus suber]